MKKSILSLLALLLANTAFSAGEKRKPNIVFILADDLGYDDVGYMSQNPKLRTPNIDALASEGMVFTDAYASCPVCSPTRASLLTGKYPASLRLTCHIPGMGMEKYLKRMNKGHKLMEAEFVDRLPEGSVTLAQALSDNGYETAFIGKWHLAGEGSVKTKAGVVDANLHPDRYGFGTNIGGCAYGQPKSYFSPYRNATLKDGPDGEYLTDRLGDEACKFIKKNKDNPFFLYLSTYTIHTPLQAPDSTVKKNGGDRYLSMIDKLDQNVGKVLRTLKASGLEENTLVIFYSDNGGMGANKPLRGAKGSLWEGGVRVPLIVKWPGKTAPNTRNGSLVTSPDFYPTILDIADIGSRKYSFLEGKSIRKVLVKNSEETDRAIFWHFPHHRKETDNSMGGAMREGDWKLIWNYETEKIRLFNLKDDLAETTDLAAKYPKKTEAMKKKLKRWLRRSEANMPLPNPDYVKM
ncbi:sulfatase [Fulvitalea axinellae]|uniref:Sulfatase n=1 Tax=Fulvitalea axinellae TaxID=1182444 RepID=A0AAU9DJI0_9BACT|nr:sulfatase [Fulvitalea axinellae]